jgi:hypothetical protein
MTGKKKEMVIVEPTSPHAAKAQFMEWREQHPQIASRLGERDLILDVIRAREGKTLHQYRIFVYEKDMA